MRSSLPRLMEFAEKHKSQADKYVLLTFHGSRADNYSELEPHLKRLSEELWKGKKLELPILFDSSMKTFRAYGISGIPNAALIDPSGRIAVMDAVVAKQMLEAELEKLRKAK